MNGNDRAASSSATTNIAFESVFGSNLLVLTTDFDDEERHHAIL